MAQAFNGPVPAHDPQYQQNLSREELHRDWPSHALSFWALFEDLEGMELVRDGLF